MSGDDYQLLHPVTAHLLTDDNTRRLLTAYGPKIKIPKYDKGRLRRALDEDDKTEFWLVIHYRGSCELLKGRDFYNKYAPIEGSA